VFRKILIANRGEIAVRILRACREMGVAAVAVFSDADRASLHVRLADEAHPIGPAPARESYLRVEKLIGVARRAGCDALHPGYGFLAENPALPRACRDAGITFIGPSPEAIEQLGSKTAARQLAHRAGVPMVPGVREPIGQYADAERAAQEIGYPVLLKAVAGGGGKGMRLVASAAELAAAWRDAGSEALNAFGEGRLYIEKYLHRPRHIEIQIFGDAHGNFIHLCERECSVQRRHQKVIEEAPSSFMTPELRRAMGEAAVRLAREAAYSNAGTVEFLVDDARNFYFLEVNTRLQVEHPVTEAVTGIDLVKLQLRIAAGEPLPFSQDDVVLRGHAIECRVYAEDPDNNFFPSPGKITSWCIPQGPGIRFDDGVYAGWTVPGDYDPLLGKLIATGCDRAEAVARLQRALDEFDAGGIRTNAGLFRAILADPEFSRGEIHTRWLDERLGALLNQPARPPLENGCHPESAAADEGPAFPGTGAAARNATAADAAAIAAALWTLRRACPPGRAASARNGAAPAPASRWKLEGRTEQLARDPRLRPDHTP
jgi:acetyl-CoA carboxylase, biotin carboxylase subunit